MRHRVNTRKLGRTSAHRLSMYRNLVTSLLDHEKVETTHAKAREVGRLADRMITLGKRGDLHARRQALRIVRGRTVNAKLFGELAERYAARTGGYTRVLRTRRRIGDAAEMSIVELVEGVAAPAAAKSSGGKKAGGRKKAGAKKDTAKKTGAKKAGAKKASSKKTTAKKTSAKKTTRKKSGSKADAD
jgi:large subunit ribosomal protein L17